MILLELTSLKTTRVLTNNKLDSKFSLSFHVFVVKKTCTANYFKLIL